MNPHPHEPHPHAHNPHEPHIHGPDEPGTHQAANPGAAMHLRWPRERFFWSIFEAPGWKQPGTLPPALLEKFAEEVPVDAASIHAVGVPVGVGRVLACGVLREDLAGLSEGALSLRPESLPEFVNAVDGEALAGGLNLLVGPWEPKPLRRARVRRHAMAAAMVILCGALVAVGFARRAARDERLASDALAATRQLLATSVPGGTPESLAAEVRRLELAAGVHRQASSGNDAGIALAELLKGWPKDVPSKPQAISVTPTTATVSVSVEGDPSPFLRAIRHEGGWAMAEPRLNAADNITRLTLQFQAAKEGGMP